MYTFILCAQVQCNEINKERIKYIFSYHIINNVFTTHCFENVYSRVNSRLNQLHRIIVRNN